MHISGVLASQQICSLGSCVIYITICKGSGSQLSSSCTATVSLPEQVPLHHFLSSCGSTEAEPSHRGSILLSWPRGLPQVTVALCQPAKGHVPVDRLGHHRSGGVRDDLLVAHIEAHQGRHIVKLILLKLEEGAGIAPPRAQHHTDDLEVQRPATPAAGQDVVTQAGPRVTDQELSILLQKGFCLLRSGVWGNKTREELFCQIFPLTHTMQTLEEEVILQANTISDISRVRSSLL